MKTLLQSRPDHHYYFVTGRLAERAVRDIVGALADEHKFSFTVGVMPITVAALMTPKWLRRHIRVPVEATHLILPGYCAAGIDELRETTEIPVICGPNDCRSLPELFGGMKLGEDFGDYDIEIIAEINHAPRLSIDEVLRRAKRLRDDGADVIDFGCDPSARCSRIGEYITAMIDTGLTVSVDTFDTWEAAEATRHGASLVLSVNSSNVSAAMDWGVEVVAIPDTPGDKKSLEKTVNKLTAGDVSMRLDPILEPIGTGFTSSIVNYQQTRQNYPNLEMMMGIGNLTELTDADSAPINLMLMGICQELGVKSVLTTEVINWSRSSVRECDLARRLTYYSIKNGIPPKRLSDGLVMLRDAKLYPYASDVLEELAKSIKDNNYRVFAQDERIHVLSSNLQLSDRDPFRLFDRLMKEAVSDNIDSAHAFYLGFEMAKASIALHLGKQYEQDESLNWGLLTEMEDLHRIERASRHRKP